VMETSVTAEVFDGRDVNPARVSEVVFWQTHCLVTRTQCSNFINSKACHWTWPWANLKRVGTACSATELLAGTVPAWLSFIVRTATVLECS
jgi:hypothetical protein